MKKFLLATAAVMVALAVVIPARAQDEKKAEKPKKHDFTGEITKIEAGTVSVKNKKGDEKSFTTGEKLKVQVPGKDAGELSDLKVGDKVTVAYSEEGDKSVAHKITHSDAKPKKDKKAKEEK